MPARHVPPILSGAPTRRGCASRRSPAARLETATRAAAILFALFLLAGIIGVYPRLADALSAIAQPNPSADRYAARTAGTPPVPAGQTERSL